MLRPASSRLSEAMVCLIVALSACNKTPPTPHAAPTAPIAAASASTATSAAAAAAPPDEPEPEPDALCERFATTAIPPGDMPSAAESAAVRGCDAEALYYGIGTPVDVARARHCGYAQIDVSGADTLMMIYANGRGVPVNLDLALRFACKVGGAPAELGGRLHRLWKARASGGPKWTQPFDVCDDATSGNMLGYCAAHTERIDSQARSIRKRAATLGMPAELAVLDAAAKRFFEARSSDEVDQSGTMRASFSIAEQASLEDELVNLLEQLHDPSFTPPSLDPKPLEKTLASLLSRIARCKSLADVEKLVPGTIQRAGIQKTQTAWVPYRAAFIALALKLHPSSKREAWLALLDQKRIAQLEPLAEGC